MTFLKQRILRIVEGAIPPILIPWIIRYRISAVLFYFKHRRGLLNANRMLHNRHTGERCFILCNGPSIKTQNIKPLKHEIVFSVSSGYLHPDYATIKPRYHCTPQITYSHKLTEIDACRWLEEMHAQTNNAEIILAHQEWKLVQKHSLFPGRHVNYLCMGMHAFPMRRKPFDLGGILPRSQSVPIMALMVALSMGFKEIYLLGVDHDWFVKKKYVYAFKPIALKDKDFGVGTGGVIESRLYDDLPMISRLWGQYRAINKLAGKLGVSIYNATEGGMLDEFPRVRLEEVVRV